jgi:hypothetical protein
MLRSIRRIVMLAMLQLQRRHLRQSQSRQRFEGRSRTTAADLQLTCPYRATSLHQLPAQAQMLTARRQENLQRCMGVVTMKSDRIRIAAEGAAALSMEAVDHAATLLVSAAGPESWPPAASAFLSRGNVTALHLRRAAEGAAETQQPIATSEAAATAESEVALHLRRPAEGAAERQQATSEATTTAESGTALQLRRAAVGDAETMQHQPRRLATSAATGGTALGLRRTANGGTALQQRRSTMLHQSRNVARKRRRD